MEIVLIKILVFILYLWNKTLFCDTIYVVVILKKEYEFNKTTAVALSSGAIKKNGYLLVRPQTFAASDTKKIEITYVIRSYTSASAFSDETVVQSFNIYSATQSWGINKKYSFTITVDLNQIYWAPSVENWEDGTSTEYVFDN